MSKNRIVGFQTDDITDMCLDLKKKEATSLGIKFNLSEFVRNAIKHIVLGDYYNGHL
jgi:two-component sensor histidine kinase